MFLEGLVTACCFVLFFCNCLCGNYVNTDAFANGHMRLLSSGTEPSSVTASVAHGFNGL